MDKPSALAGLFSLPGNSLASLEALSNLLNTVSGPWPVFELQCCYARAWRKLPENVKAGAGSPESKSLLESVERHLKTSYGGLSSLLPTFDAPAIIDHHSRATLTHEALSTFVRDFKLPCRVSGSAKPRIALALPNGPLLGLAILAVTTYSICCPLSTASGHEQFKSDLAQCGASVVFVTTSDVTRLGLGEAWVEELSIQVVIVQQESDLTFSMRCKDDGQPLSATTRLEPNRADDMALLLFTSGTSGTKKTVPITIHALISGIAFVMESWGLRSNDVCLNMMPLFHIGGIVRNLFAPIMAGGATICCAGFDANSFWDIVEDHTPTWYYASPTMHQVILDTSKYRQAALCKSNMRLICNAAGGLLPSLASKLRDTFDCTVLPSYGMTECMPISSPPLDYKLDRPGTSGVSVGPDLAILDGNDEFMIAGEIGRIVVRGAPLFHGYLMNDGSLDTTPFTTTGFFDTGDLGYLDEAGYLFVTGRSKEVINRGGELISPFEIEEAILSASRQSGSPIEGRVSATLAFSMPHNVLQETVGLVVVTTPGAWRVCLKSVQAAIKDSLSPAKWPQVLVFMDDLPKNNNKLLRIRMAERMDMQDLPDDVLLADRHFNAACPPPNTPLSRKIPTTPYLSDMDAISDALSVIVGPGYDVYLRTSRTCGYPEAIVALASASQSQYSYPPDFDPLKMMKSTLNDIDIPVACHLLTTKIPINEDGDVDQAELDIAIAQTTRSLSINAGFGATEAKVANLFAEILAYPPAQLRRDSDFFELGGDSMRAGRLLSELRRESSTRIPVDLLFTAGRISSIAEYMDSSVSSTVSEHKSESCDMKTEVIVESTCSSTNPFLLLLQLVPITLVYPMKRALSWTIFMYVLSATQAWTTANTLPGRLFNLVFSLSIGRLISFMLFPLFGISMKWILIGRFREGVYPMWSLYHTRWWLVQKILSICGKGHFEFSDVGLVFYYRLLGARIGSGVTISPQATLGEYDLLDIGNGVNLDKCICRGFAVEKNTAMYLGRIKIGQSSSIGLNSVVAPGTIIPENTCIGPNSSSWEFSDAEEANRNLSTNRIPRSNLWLELVVSSIAGVAVNFVRVLPWMVGLIGLVIIGPQQDTDQVLAVLKWFSEPYRIGYHYFALILHSYFGPMTWFLAVVVAKRLIDTTLGRQRPGPAETKSSAQRLRTNILHRLISQARFHKIVDIFGAHYEITSMLYRQLGAKVGQRVYWPGTGPIVQDFDLLDIGDDVVFGSRANIMTSDGYGSEMVKIGNGAMISDRVVVLPGTHIGDGTVFGTGGLSRRDKYYSADTVWVGSRAGEAVCLSDGRSKRSLKSVPTSEPVKEGAKQGLVVTISEKPALESGLTTPRTLSAKSSNMSLQTPPSPFGRAFYSGLAPYRVWGLPWIILYSSFITIFTAFFWNVASTSSVQIVARILPSLTGMTTTNPARPFVIYALFTACISVLHTSLAVLALCITISAKWILLGRRVAGNYDWDKSSYCQRWQLYLTIERLRRQCYGSEGILGLITGTHYMVLYFRALGAKIGRDCALFASGTPSCLFTEPDLVTLGDRVAIDDASVVAHINSRGVFNLNELHIGDGSVLRSGSRLLSGAKMGKGAVLLEHTLVMAGDEVDDNTTRQGWPSEEFDGPRMPGVGVTDQTEKV